MTNLQLDIFELAYGAAEHEKHMRELYGDDMRDWP